MRVAHAKRAPLAEGRSRRGRRRAVALVLAGGGTAGMLVAAHALTSQTASAEVLARCTLADHSLDFGADPPARVAAQGECLKKTPANGEGANLGVRIFRDDVLVWSGGNGTGITTGVYICRGTAWGSFRAQWSTGQTDGPFSAPCG